MAHRESTPSFAQEENARIQRLPGMPERHPAKELGRYVADYARERPDVVALWCFGIGFVLGWKLKPW